MVNDFDIEEEVIEVENRFENLLDFYEMNLTVEKEKRYLLLFCKTLCLQREENLAKIARRVKDYKVEELNPPREGKRLLVLDVDYTLFGELLI